MGCHTRHLTRLGLIWGLPNSCLGLGFALLSLSVPRVQHGLLIAESDRGLAWWFLSRRGFGAITLGRVVVSAVPITAQLVVHEGHHARQYEVLGVSFLPIYLWQHARRGYAGNPLEREAEACAAQAVYA